MNEREFRQEAHAKKTQTRAVFDDQARRSAARAIKKLMEWVRTSRQPKGFALCDAEGALIQLRLKG